MKRKSRAILCTLSMLVGCGGEQPSASPRPETTGLMPIQPALRSAVEGIDRKGVPLSASDAPSDTLRAVRFLGDSLQMQAISQLAIVGEEIVVADQFSSPHLAIVAAGNGRVETRLGKQGRGAGELIAPVWFAADLKDRASLWVYDFTVRRFSRIHRDQTGWVEGKTSVSFRPDVPLLNPVWTDAGIASNGVFADYILMLMDSAGKPTRRLSFDSPFTTAVMPHNNGLRMLNRTYLAHDPAVQRFALVYQWTNRLDFFTGTGEVIGTVVAPRPVKPIFDYDDKKFYWREGSEMAYIGAAGTERYVYALFCGCKNGSKAPPSRLHVFKWNGDFVGEIVLDREISTFDVTEDDTKVIGGTAGPDARLVEWILPRWVSQETRS